MLLPILRKRVFIFIALVIASYAISLAIFVFLEPAPIANTIGLLSLFCYIATIIPGIARVIYPASKRNKILIWIVRNRRYTGVAAFGFGLNHAVLLILERHLNLLDYKTDVHCLEGLATLIIFTILATTSNDWTVKNLKTNWIKLHKLTYLAIFLLPWHVFNKMGGHWSHITPLAVLMTTATAILFVSRKWVELKASQPVSSQQSTETTGFSQLLLPSWSFAAPLALLITKVVIILSIRKKWVEELESKYQPEFSQQGNKPN